uniref:ATP synthase F0 subunit 8 n=1 Tax=Prosadenoporus spectaculum TaxID=1332185 RepID=X2C8V5_9BILA|nr:ATP synthase F0 subunit 8 [Prosadenoporus spectaculum]AGL46785.1 ATP synthase F0 subunit 8 [Prosadenoporus spectaculum]
MPQISPLSWVFIPFFFSCFFLYLLLGFGDLLKSLIFLVNLGLMVLLLIFCFGNDSDCFL